MALSALRYPAPTETLRLTFHGQPLVRYSGRVDHYSASPLRHSLGHPGLLVVATASWCSNAIFIRNLVPLRELKSKFPQLSNCVTLTPLNVRKQYGTVIQGWCSDLLSRDGSLSVMGTIPEYLTSDDGARID